MGKVLQKGSIANYVVLEHQMMGTKGAFYQSKRAHIVMLKSKLQSLEELDLQLKKRIEDIKDLKPRDDPNQDEAS